MLEAEGLVKSFGGLRAVDGVDLRVESEEIRCIVGPNGAGKTTLFGLLTGVLSPTAGEVRLAGRRIDRLPVHKVARLGMVQKFQVPAVFADLSVWDNLRVSADGILHLPSLFRDRRNAGDLLPTVLEDVGLIDHAATPAERLSHGQLQWLEIGMLLVQQPRVVLLDEPTAGMTLGETARTAELLRTIARRRSLTAVIVEHDMEFIRMIGDRVTVLHKGRVLAEGPVDAIEANDEVRRVYLGEDI